MAGGPCAVRLVLVQLVVIRDLVEGLAVLLPVEVQLI